MIYLSAESQTQLSSETFFGFEQILNEITKKECSKQKYSEMIPNLKLRKSSALFL